MSLPQVRTLSSQLMRYTLVSHIAKALNVPQGTAERLLKDRSIIPIGKYGFTHVYDADDVDRKLKVNVGVLIAAEAAGVIPLNRPDAKRCD